MEFVNGMQVKTMRNLFSFLCILPLDEHQEICNVQNFEIFSKFVFKNQK